MKRTNTILINSILTVVSLFCAGCLDTKSQPYTKEDIIADDKIVGQWIYADSAKQDTGVVYKVVSRG